ncbi:MAG: lipoyl(octanoyl) transferase LipB [Deltaproteobacteria bacterium]|nr:lipoyl(octanoyl) transferase LipB [Deltaproteobacteria bacterium]MBW1930660.1 lipoyl(octanoyl) transferase LipB [Deltaproteobacteria bacterium]MBW2023927.1 lipoyl(octanoyl) transferase LipB [Deltaproteobacteria bacterium]MBW2124316.1 lipoyl(octanoyl) transferase LipB [Deltaproteobacteria bacterium]RLB19378.1 MAG: octanoyltransferase [Deltaproteobacteria bacterium]
MGWDTMIGISEELDAAIDKGVEKGWLLLDLGVMPYGEVWEFQHQVVAAKVEGRISANIFMLLEHEPVFTLGRRGQREHLLVSEHFLDAQGVPVIHVERGGDITYHGPGQVVGYPIVDLRQIGWKVVKFVEALEEVMICTVADFGIKAERNPLNRGIWVGPEKLGSVGIAVRHGITFHGFALNVSLSMEPFSWIHPCGLRDVRMTSMKHVLGQELDMESVRSSIRRHMERIFGVELEKLPLHSAQRTYFDSIYRGNGSV